MHEVTLGLVAGVWVMLGFACAQVSGRDDGERVGIDLKLFQAITIIEELDDRKFKSVAAAEDFMAEVVGLPVLLIVGEYGQAGDWAGVAVIEPIVIGEHASSKPAVALPLHFDVDIDQEFLCAVPRRGLSVGANPTRQLSLQPVATRAIVEGTKWLKPLV